MTPTIHEACSSRFVNRRSWRSPGVADLGPSGQRSGLSERFSVDVGAVRYTDRFGLAKAVAPEVVRAVLAAIATDFGRLDGRARPHALVGMGGAVTNITAVRHGLATYDPDVVQGSVLDRAEVDRQIERYRSLDAEARRSIGACSRSGPRSSSPAPGSSAR